MFSSLIVVNAIAMRPMIALTFINNSHHINRGSFGYVPLVHDNVI